MNLKHERDGLLDTDVKWDGLSSSLRSPHSLLRQSRPVLESLPLPDSAHTKQAGTANRCPGLTLLDIPVATSSRRCPPLQAFHPEREAFHQPLPCRLAYMPPCRKSYGCPPPRCCYLTPPRCCRLCSTREPGCRPRLPGPTISHSSRRHLLLIAWQRHESLPRNSRTS